jgi:cytidylate kinase
MGTVVFPGAPLKVFLTATLEARALRRLRQDGEDESPRALSEESARIMERDARDEGRHVAPLRRAPGALVIDTTDLAFQAQVDRIVKVARAALGF